MLGVRDGAEGWADGRTGSAEFIRDRVAGTSRRSARDANSAHNERRRRGLSLPTFGKDSMAGINWSSIKQGKGEIGG
jgi:hypothetical protein